MQLQTVQIPPVSEGSSQAGQFRPLSGLSRDVEMFPLVGGGGVLRVRRIRVDQHG